MTMPFISKRIVGPLLLLILALAVSSQIHRQTTEAATSNRIIGSDTLAADSFGTSISVYGDTAVVGAMYDDIGICDSCGSAYVFYNVGGVWTEQAKLVASDGADGDWFGGAVSIYGDNIIVGAFFDDVGANTDQGSAYIFSRNQGGADSWGQVKKLTASDGAADDWFGGAVSIYGDYAVVGADNDTVTFASQGSAYVFYKEQDGPSNWGQQAKLTASDGFTSDGFGVDVSMFDNAIVIGSWKDNDFFADGGSAYVYVKPGGSWVTTSTFDAKLRSSDMEAYDLFGQSVSIYMNTIVVGTLWDDSLRGSAYVFKKPEGGWSGTLTEDAKLTASDGEASDYFGVPVTVYNGYILAFGDAGDNGAVYVFKEPTGGWSGSNENYKIIIDEDGYTNSSSVAINGDYAFISASDGTNEYVYYFLMTCGNGSVDHAYEECDDGNLRNNDGCTFACTDEYCGDGTLQTSVELCDDGNTDDGDGCDSTCRTICGDGIIMGYETCDDSNTEDGDGCSSTCGIELDGGCYLQSPVLPIAAGGTVDDTFCNGVCIGQGYPGGFAASSTSCFCNDSGGTDTGYCGTNVCDVAAAAGIVPITCGHIDCGNGEIDKVEGEPWVIEKCDDGVNNGTYGYCNVTCTAVLECGDQKVQPGEECDDGNTLSGDGCSSDCKIEECEIIADIESSEIKLTASDGAVSDLFGIPIFISDDYIAITAISDDTNRGAAYVFYNDPEDEPDTGWEEVQKLTADIRDDGDMFGVGIESYGDYLMISAPGDDDLGSGAGAIYVFYNDPEDEPDMLWQQVDKLMPSDGAANDAFGTFFEISEDLLLIGAPNHNNIGAAYVFYFNGSEWIEQQKLTASDGKAGDGFGAFPAIYGDYALIPAISAGADNGAIYIFRNNGLEWVEQQKIMGEADVMTGYGFFPAISNDYAITGAPLSDSFFGALYIYFNDNGLWSEYQKLLSDDGYSGQGFGFGNTLSNDYILSGALGDNSNQGALYIYSNDGVEWVEEYKLTSTDGLPGDQFGAFSVTRGEKLIVASTSSDSGTGAAYLYDFRQCSIPATGGSKHEGSVPEPTCTPPQKLNISDAYVGQESEGATVTLLWRPADMGAVSQQDKIDLLYRYFETEPMIGDVKLKNLFARYMQNKYFEGDNADVCSDLSDEDEEMLLDIKNSNDTDIRESIVKFVDDLIALERILVRTGKISEKKFTNYYNAVFGQSGGTGTISIKRISKQKSIPDKTFTDINPALGIWTDINVPSGKYEYQIISINNCLDEVYGDPYLAEEVALPIDPGKNVDVTLNLQIKIKETFKYKIMQRLRDMFKPEDVDVPSYGNETCKNAKQDLFITPNSENAKKYLVLCSAGLANEKIPDVANTRQITPDMFDPNMLKKEIIKRQKELIPPLVATIKGLNGRATQGAIMGCLQGKIWKILDWMEYRKENKPSIKVGDFIDLPSIEDIMGNQDAIDKIQYDIGEDYFAGVSNSADIEIIVCENVCDPEKIDLPNFYPTYPAHTNIFGETTVDIGTLTSGTDYELRIRLKGDDYKYVLPKKVKLTVNNANRVEINPYEMGYEATINLRFDKPFRYGNFDLDDNIDLDDFEALADLLSGKNVRNICDLWELWQFADVDGIEGIDIRDFAVLIENWGGLREFKVEEKEISLFELLELFGVNVKLTPELETTVKVANWVDLIDSDC